MPATAQRPVRPKLLTALCCVSMMCLALGMNLLPVFLTTLDTKFGGATGLPKEQLGRLGAYCFAGLVIGIIITGPLADRYGAKLFAILGNIITAASLVGMALAPTYNALCTTLFFMGLGGGMTDMILSPIVSALNPARRASALNWLHAFFCVGAVLTIAIGTLSLRFNLGWTPTCLILFTLPLILTVVMFPLTFPTISPRADPATGTSTRTRTRDLIRHRWFLVALLAIFLGGSTEVGLVQWLPAYTERNLHYPVWIGGTALLFFSLAMILGRILVSNISRFLNPFDMMIVGSALTIPLFLIGSFFPVPIVALIALILAGFTGSCLWPTTLAVTADRYPNGGASMFGLLAALGNAGCVFMPWLIGIIADHSNLHIALALSSIAPLLMIPTILHLKKNPLSPKTLPKHPSPPLSTYP